MRDDRLTHGILWMSLAQLLFVVSWSAIKFLGSRLPLFEIIFFRGLISLGILLPLTSRGIGTLRGKNLRALFLRALFGFLAMILAFYAMIHMKMGNAATLFNTLPIFVALLSPLMLGESFSMRTFGLIIIAFIGIGMILRPTPEIVSHISLIALTAGLMGAFAMIFVRKLAATDASLTVTLHFTAFTTLASIPLALSNCTWPTLLEWLWLLVIGIALTFAQLFMTHAYRYAKASSIAPFSYVSVIGSYLAGLLIFSELPDKWSLLGTSIIIASGVGLTLLDTRSSMPRALKRGEISVISSLEDNS